MRNLLVAMADRQEGRKLSLYGQLRCFLTLVYAQDTTTSFNFMKLFSERRGFNICVCFIKVFEPNSRAVKAGINNTCEVSCLPRL